MKSTLLVTQGHAPDLTFPRGFDWCLTVSNHERTVVHRGWRVSEAKAYRAAARELTKVRKAMAVL